MSRSALIQQFIPDFVSFPLSPLLQDGFCVVKKLFILKIRQDKVQNEFSGHFNVLAVKVHGTDQSLHDVGDDGVLLSSAAGFLAPAKPYECAQGQVPGAISQSRFADQRSPQFCQLAFLFFRISTEKEFTGDHLQDSIPQKLDPLIIFIGLYLLFIGKGGVGQSTFQQISVRESVPDPFLQ